MTVETAAPVVAEPVVAPVAAPVVAPAPIVIGAPEVPAQAAPVVAPDEGTTVVFDPTGDAALDVALNFVGKLGISMDHPAMQATANGDFSLIKAHLATMGAKAQGWEQMVALAEDAHERSTTAANEKAGKITAAVHNVAGGESNWNTVSTWASANATPDEKAELNAMFAAGPTQARAAALMLMNLHAKASGTTVLPASAVSNATAGTAALSNTGPLSIREYSDAVRELVNKVGSSNLHSSPEYAALGKRLAA